MSDRGITARQIFINFRIISGRMPLRAILLWKKLVDLLIRTISTFILCKRGVKLKVIYVQTLVFHRTISNVSKVLRKYTQE